MTPVFCCGFECGVSSSNAHFLATGTSSFVTSTIRNGARSLRINPAGGTGQAVWTSGSSPTVVIGRAYVIFATLPNATVEVFTSIFSTTRCGVYFKSSDSKIYAGQATGNLSATGISVTTGVWYRIEFKCHYTNGTIDVSVDGVSIPQFTPGSMGSTGANIQCGTSANSTCDMYFDDVLVSHTNADYPLGAGYVNHFVPTSDGTHNVAGAADFRKTLTATDITNSTTDAYQLVDDIPMESGSGTDWINIIAPPNASDYVRVKFGAAPGISTPTIAPRAVEVIVAWRQAGTGAGDLDVFISAPSISSFGTDVVARVGVAGVTTIDYTRKQFANQYDNAQGAWTVAAFNDSQILCKTGGTNDANPDQYVCSYMIEAEFQDIVVIPNKIIQVKQAVNRASTY